MTNYFYTVKRYGLLTTLLGLFLSTSSKAWEPIFQTSFINSTNMALNIRITNKFGEFLTETKEAVHFGWDRTGKLIPVEEKDNGLKPTNSNYVSYFTLPRKKGFFISSRPLWLVNDQNNELFRKTLPIVINMWPGNIVPPATGDKGSLLTITIDDMSKWQNTGWRIELKGYSVVYKQTGQLSID